MPHSYVPGFDWCYGNSEVWLGHFHYTLRARKQTNLYNTYKQSFLISFNGTLKTRLSIVCCVLNNLLMIIKDAQSLPTISALYLTKEIRVQEESKWNELDPRRRCYLQRNPEGHKDSKGRVKCSLICTTDTQGEDAKTLEWDYKSRRVSGFFSFLSKGFHPKEVA